MYERRVAALFRSSSKWANIHCAPLLLAAAQVIAVAAAAEWAHPYFFLQDDNRTFVLPHLVHNWRALQQGELAQFNFYQYCGTPALANGQAGTLYPLNYVTTGVSYALSGGPWAAVDVLTLLHLLIGASGGYFMLRQYGIGRWPAAWAGSAAVLNTFVFYVGGSWPGVTAAAAYLPWALGYARRLALQQPRAAYGLVAVHVLWFLSGHPQFFLYGAVFEAIVYVFSLPRPWRTALAPVARYSFAWIASLLLSAPLLLPMLRQMSLSADRAAPLPFRAFAAGIYYPHLWLSGVLFPFSSFWYGRIPSTRFIARSSAYFSHVSYAVITLALIAAVVLLRRRIDARLRTPAILFLSCAALAGAWSGGLLSIVLYFVPLSNRVRWPFKLQLFTAFFIAAAAGVGLEHVVRRATARRRRMTLAAATAATAANFIFLYAASPIRAFRPSAGALPVVDARPQDFPGGRVLSVGYEWKDLDAPGSLGFMYPTLAGVQGFGGYDPLVTKLNSEVALGLNHMSSPACEAIPSKLPHLRLWAVSYYVAPAGAADCHRILGELGMRVVERSSLRRVYVDAKSLPVVSWEDGSATGIACRTGVNDVTCIVMNSAPPDSPPARLRMRYAAHDGFSALVDRQPASLAKSNDNQLVLAVPPGTHSVVLAYGDPLTAAGFGMAAATLGLLTLPGIVRRTTRCEKVSARGT